MSDDTKREIGWLIETVTGQYWCGGKCGWTSSPNLACRFARARDAHAAREWLRIAPVDTRVAEHVWLGNAPPAEAAPAPKSVWLIERGQKEFHTPTIWYAADSKHPEDARYAGRWTENANRAVKFATQEECEQTVYNEFMRYWGDRRVNCHASEHVFLDRPPATHPRDRK